jgi:hypothetical protein
MSFLKILSRLAKTHYFLLVLSLIVVIPFTFLPIISSTPFPIISEAWAATYCVDATNGNDTNNGLSEATPWKTIAKTNASVFNPGDQILFKGGRIGGGDLSFLLQDKKANRLSVSLFHLAMPDTLSIKGHSPTLFRMDPNDQPQNTNVGPAAFVKNKNLTPIFNAPIRFRVVTTGISNGVNPPFVIWHLFCE